MIKKIIGIVVVLLVVAVGYVGFSFFRTPEEASAPLEAIPVVVEEPTVAPAAPAETTTEPVVEAAAPTEEAVAEPVEPAAEPASEVAAVETSPTVFEIVPAESEVRFLIDEVLRGSDFTVVGVTDQVAGQIAVDPADLSSAQMGPILVNARTLATDNDFRNRALKNRILTTDEYEFITFTPTEIVGLSGSATTGESYSFQIVGDLTIRDVTRPVTFDATASLASETQLVGSATVTVLYDDFNLTIPASEAVSAVDDDVRLEIDFVATAVEAS